MFTQTHAAVTIYKSSAICYVVKWPQLKNPWNLSYREAWISKYRKNRGIRCCCLF